MQAKKGPPVGSRLSTIALEVIVDKKPADNQPRKRTNNAAKCFSLRLHNEDEDHVAFVWYPKHHWTASTRVKLRRAFLCIYV
jgi:hypothetical protein